MTFFIDNDDTTISGGAIGSQILELTQRQDEVFYIIKEDSKISYRAIAKQLNINKSAVLKQIELYISSK